MARTAVVPVAAPVGTLSAQMRRPPPRSAMSGSRRFETRSNVSSAQKAVIPPEPVVLAMRPPRLVRIGCVASRRSSTTRRPRLVLTHEPRVADHAGGGDRRYLPGLAHGAPFDHVLRLCQRRTDRKLDSLFPGDHHRREPRAGAKMDVGEWLRALGLSRYEGAFREAEIGPDVLPELTDSDLEKLGVSLGDSKRLLKAIASLGPAQVLAEPKGPSPTPSSIDTAERRQLTVMFCDLVGSTALSARLDPEDMREIISAYQDACSAAVARYDGFVANFMGDGVLAYFGFPRAHRRTPSGRLELA
jgi:hypothetical protein